MKDQQVRTSILFHKLFKASMLDEFIEQDLRGISVPPFHEYITVLSKEKGEVAERIINRAGIERSFGHQLFNGIRKPSRDTTIQLAFGFNMNVDEAQKLLRAAQKNALYPKIKRDAAIIFCLNKHMTIVETQSMLHTLDITLLGGRKNHA